MYHYSELARVTFHSSKIYCYEIILDSVLSKYLYPNAIEVSYASNGIGGVITNQVAITFNMDSLDRVEVQHIINKLGDIEDKITTSEKLDAYSTQLNDHMSLIFAGRYFDTLCLEFISYFRNKRTKTSLARLVRVIYDVVDAAKAEERRNAQDDTL